MKINLSKLKRQLGKQKRSNAVKGVRYSPIVAMRYERDLLSLVKILEKAAIEYIESLKNKGYIADSIPKFDLSKQMKNLDTWAKETSEKFASGAETFHRKEWRNELNDKTGIDIKNLLKNETIKPTLDKHIKENVDLIKSIPKEYHDRINEAINNGIVGGDDSVTLKKAISEIGDITENRASLIARDQTAKMLSDLNQIRQTEIGIEAYIWSTVGDDRVRETHATNDGKRFYWNDPPDETGHPGEDVQCRCVADPDLSDLVALVRSANE